MDMTLETIRLIADQEHAKYPQYQNHWDGWKLCVVTKKVKTKMGNAFYAGEIAMYNPNDIRTHEHGTFYTVYSVNNKCDTSVKAKDIKVLPN